MENKPTYIAPEFTVEVLNENDIVLMSISEGVGELPGVDFPGLKGVQSDW